TAARSDICPSRLCQKGSRTRHACASVRAVLCWCVDSRPTKRARKRNRLRDTCAETARSGSWTRRMWTVPASVRDDLQPDRERRLVEASRFLKGCRPCRRTASARRWRSYWEGGSVDARHGSKILREIQLLRDHRALLPTVAHGGTSADRSAAGRPTVAAQ